MNNEINRESGHKIKEMHVLHGCKKKEILNSQML